MGAAFPEMRFLPNHIRFQGPLSKTESEQPSASGFEFSLSSARPDRAFLRPSCKPGERFHCLPGAGRSFRRIRLHGPPFAVRALVCLRIGPRAL